MKEQFNIHTLITDDQKKIHLFVTVDTAANRIYIHSAKPENDSDEAIGALFNKDVDYHLNISSDFVVRLVDELGGIQIEDKTCDGKTALQLIREDKLDDVVDATADVLEKKNLLTTIPALLKKLSDTYEMDIAIKDIITTLFSEIRELKDWKIEFVH